MADLVAEAELIAAEEGLVLNLPEGFTLESGTFDALIAELLRYAETTDGGEEPPVVDDGRGEGGDGGGLIEVPAL